MREPTAAEIAYAAGFFDGEGSVTIEERPQRASKNPNWRLNVRISQVDPAPLRLLSEIWGGSISAREPGLKKNQAFFQWQLHSAQAGIFLAAIAPHCLVKARQIRVALEFRSRLRITGCRGMSGDEVAERRRLKTEIRSNNRWARSARFKKTEAAFG